MPIAILGQAVSQASLPYSFARLFNEKRLKELDESVNGSIYRIVAVSLLATSFMMCSTALPRLIDLRIPPRQFQVLR